MYDNVRSLSFFLKHVRCQKKITMSDEDLEDIEVRLSGESSDEEGSSEEEDEEEEWDEDRPLYWKGRLSLLEKLRETMQSSDLFDDDDVDQIDTEMERVREKERNSFETKLKNRLRLLTKYDTTMNFAVHHPELNTYFIEKQKKMMELADQAS